jgi:hypothetical protein
MPIISSSNNVNSLNQVTVQTYSREISDVASMMVEIMFIYENKDLILEAFENTDMLKDIQSSLTEIERLHSSVNNLDTLTDNILFLKDVFNELNIIKNVYENLGMVSRVDSSLSKLLSLHDSLQDLIKLEHLITDISASVIMLNENEQPRIDILENRWTFRIPSGSRGHTGNTPIPSFLYDPVSKELQYSVKYVDYASTVNEVSNSTILNLEEAVLGATIEITSQQIQEAAEKGVTNYLDDRLDLLIQKELTNNIAYYIEPILNSKADAYFQSDFGIEVRTSVIDYLDSIKDELKSDAPGVKGDSGFTPSIDLNLSVDGKLIKEVVYSESTGTPPPNNQEVLLDFNEMISKYLESQGANISGLGSSYKIVESVADITDVSNLEEGTLIYEKYSDSYFKYINNSMQEAFSKGDDYISYPSNIELNISYSSDKAQFYGLIPLDIPVVGKVGKIAYIKYDDQYIESIQVTNDGNIVNLPNSINNTYLNKKLVVEFYTHSGASSKPIEPHHELVTINSYGQANLVEGTVVGKVGLLSEVYYDNELIDTVITTNENNAVSFELPTDNYKGLTALVEYVRYKEV